MGTKKGVRAWLVVKEMFGGEGTSESLQNYKPDADQNSIEGVFLTLDELAPAEALIDNSIAGDKIFDNALRKAVDVVKRGLRKRDGQQKIIDEILAQQRLGIPEDEDCTCDGITKCRNCECAGLYKDAATKDKLLSTLKGCEKFWDYGEGLHKCKTKSLCAECTYKLVALMGC